MTESPLQPSWRKPFGMLLLLLWLAVYALGVAALAGSVSALPGLAQLLFYAVAGLAWLAPVKPLLVWMNTGRWSVK